MLTEDNLELAKTTALNLKELGFAVDVASSGEEALRLLENNEEYDVIVLDLILPDIDGTKLLDEIKSKAPSTPVLALTARDAEDNRIKGIQIGFDDYMTKPFSYHELAARMRVLYRSRHYRREKIIKIGSLQINPQNQTTLVNRAPVKLSLNEFRVLYYLARNRNKAVSAEELLTSVWDNNDYQGTAKVFTTISRLRAKLGDRQKNIIKTHKDGYIIT